MTPSTVTNSSYTVSRPSPWLAIVSGILGLCSFVSLVAYITTPALQMQESGAVVPLGKMLLTVQFLASAVQVLMMIPVAIWIYRLWLWVAWDFFGWWLWPMPPYRTFFSCFRWGWLACGS
jgi:hypothetical protein